MARANPQSGESEEGVIKRTHSAYMRTALFPTPFDHISTYNQIKDQPRWRLYNEEIEALARKAKEVVEPTMREKIMRRRITSVTAASTDKPEGVKKARRSQLELVAKMAEEVQEEEVMTAWMEVETDRKRIAKRVLEASWARTRAMQEKVNEKSMGTVLHGMTGDELQLHTLRKKHAMQEILKEESRREAEIADAAAEVRATADAADAAARAAAIAAVGAAAAAAADDADAADVADAAIAAFGADAVGVPEAVVATLARVADISEMLEWNGGYLSDDSLLESEVVRGNPLLYV